MRDTIRTFVENKTPFNVCGEAGNGREAIDKAKGCLPDLVIIDLAMPVMNGIEAGSVLRRMFPRMPIVLLTNHADMVGQALAKTIGVTKVVSKSDQKALEKCLDTLLGPNAPLG